MAIMLGLPFLVETSLGTKVYTGQLLLRSDWYSSVAGLKSLTAALPTTCVNHGRAQETLWLQEACGHCPSSPLLYTLYSGDQVEDSLPNTGSRRNASPTQNDFQLNYVSRVICLEISIPIF